METQSRSSHFTHPGSRLLGACKFGQAAAAFPFPAPHSWLNILPVSSPAVLGCCSRQPLPRCPPSRARRESLVPAPWAQPGASSAVGDLHCFLLSLSDPKHQTRSREGAPGGPRWPRNCVECRFRERIFFFFFQSVNLFNVPCLKVPALDRLWRGASWQGLAWGRCSCPGSGFIAVGFRGVLSSLPF